MKENFLKLDKVGRGILLNLTLCINGGVDLFKRPNNFFDGALILEKLEFALFKIERVTDEYCKYSSSNQQSQEKTLLLKNKDRGEIAIKQCKQYLDREVVVSQVKITNLSVYEFFDGSSYSSSPERFPRKESAETILVAKVQLNLTPLF